MKHIFILFILFLTVSLATAQNVKITKAIGQYAAINMGRDQGIQEGQQFVVMRLQNNKLITIGYATVIKVLPGKAAIRIDHPEIVLHDDDILVWQQKGIQASTKPIFSQIKIHFGYQGLQLSNLKSAFREGIKFIEQTDNTVGTASINPISGNLVYGGDIAFLSTEGLGIMLSANYLQTEYGFQFNSTNPGISMNGEVSLFNIVGSLVLFHQIDKTIKCYLSFGGGFGYAKMKSFGEPSFFAENAEQLQARYKGNGFVGNGVVGIEYRVAPHVGFYAEGGYTYANMGRLEGSIWDNGEQIYSGVARDISKQFIEFDFSGGLIRGGVLYNF